MLVSSMDVVLIVLFRDLNNNNLDLYTTRAASMCGSHAKASQIYWKQSGLVYVGGRSGLNNDLDTLNSPPLSLLRLEMVTPAK